MKKESEMKRKIIKLREDMEYVDYNTVDMFEDYMQRLYKDYSTFQKDKNGSFTSVMISDLNNGKYGFKNYFFSQPTVQAHLNVTHNDNLEPIRIFEINSTNEYLNYDHSNNKYDDDLFSDLFTNPLAINFSDELSFYFSDKYDNDKRLIKKILGTEGVVGYLSFEAFVNEFQRKYESGESIYNILVDIVSKEGYLNYKLDLSNKNVANFNVSRKNGLYKVSKSGMKYCKKVLDDLFNINNESLERFEKFFSNYGFFYNINYPIFHIDGLVLLAIKERVEQVYQLNAELKTLAPECNYSKILKCILYLIFSENYQLEPSSEYIVNTSANCVWNEYVFYLGVDHDIENKSSFNPYNGFYHDNYYENSLDDFQKISICEFIKQIYNYSDKHSGGNNSYPLKQFSKILKWFEENVSKISDYNNNEIIANGIEIDDNKIEKAINSASEEIKLLILDFAKLLLKSEFKYHLSGVTVELNETTLMPNLKINNLLAAIYYSIFYYKADIITLHQCEFCDNLFSELISNNKQYCSGICRDNNKAEKRRAKKAAEKIYKKKSESNI